MFLLPRNQQNEDEFKKKKDNSNQINLCHVFNCSSLSLHVMDGNVYKEQRHILQVYDLL